MAIPKNDFSITAKLYRELETSKNGHPKLSLVVNSSDDDDDNTMWVTAMACQEKIKLELDSLTLQKFDVVNVKGTLTPPRVWKDKAYLTMFINEISRWEKPVDETEEKVAAQEESTNEEDIPF